MVTTDTEPCGAQEQDPRLGTDTEQRQLVLVRRGYNNYLIEYSYCDNNSHSKSCLYTDNGAYSWCGFGIQLGSSTAQQIRIFLDRRRRRSPRILPTGTRGRSVIAGLQQWWY